jgi:hypothetical protein
VPEPQEQVDETEQREQRADADHGLEGEPHHVDRRLIGQRHDVQALDDRVRVMEGEDRQQPGDLDAPDDRVPVIQAEQVLGGALGGVREPFHRGQLDRLVDRHVTGRPVTDDDLKRRGDAGGRHRDAERGALVAAAPAAQERPRVRAAEQEAADDVGGEVHVDVLAPEQRVVEQRLPRVHVDRAAAAEGETGRVVHPAVDRDDEERARHAGDGDRNAAREMRPRLKPVPPISINTYEYGFEEEGEALKREAEPEHVTEVLHPHRPQQPELEGQDRAGDDAHREQREHDPRPAFRQHAVERIAGAEVAVLGEKHEYGEGDAEAHERDVHGQRERLQLPRLVQIVLVHVHVGKPTSLLLHVVVAGPRNETSGVTSVPILTLGRCRNINPLLTHS